MDEKQAFTQVFNLVAELYDNPSLRFFPACAEKIVEHAQIKPGQKVLDVATGTGVVAIAAAQAVGDTGSVDAIDLSENMLGQAKKKYQQTGLSNINFQIMDGENPEFEDNSFDVITSSYGLFFMPDMPLALKSWSRVLKPGGKIIFSSFAPSAFVPLRDVFMENLAEYDITPPPPRWLQLAEEELCKSLLTENGFTNPAVTQVQLGYYLEGPEDWWRSVQSAGYRGMYEQLPEEHRDEFQLKHLAEIEKLVTDKGLWLDVQTLLSTAIKPE